MEIFSEVQIIFQLFNHQTFLRLCLAVAVRAFRTKPFMGSAYFCSYLLNIIIAVEAINIIHK